MPDSRELQIVLKMKDELGGKLDALQKNLDKTNKEVSKSEGAFNQFAGAVAAAVSVGAIIEFARRSVQAASEAQTAFTKLAHILNTSTGATEAQVMMLADQAQALERVGVVTGDVVMAAQAQLATFDLQAESIQKLIPSFLDMVVAEKGVNATTDDMIGYANALGMALDGNYGALTKRGFKLDEATQQMIEHGTETERIDAITQVLNSTYEGLNEQMSQTFEGRMKRAQTIVGNLQQDIGFALIPTIEALIGDFIGLTDSLAGNQARVDAWAKGIYRATNFLIGMAKGVKLVGEILAFLGDSLVSLVRIWGTGVGEMFYAFTQLGSHVKTIATAIAKAFTGDFQGAADTLKSAVKEAFSYTIGEMDRMAFNTAGWAEQIKATWQDIGDSANKSINLEGFKPVSVASAAAYRNMSQGAKDTAREVEGLAKEVKSMDEAYQKLQEKSADALFDMEQDHAKSLESIRGEIKKTEAAMNDLYF
jgi:archaellum component FlaC